MPETPRRRVPRRTAVVTVALLVAATGTTAAARKQPPVADLRADVNQDGRVDVAGSSDEAGEEAWRPGRGAVFLANVDDDSRRCRMRLGGLDRVDPAVDERLAACHDAADERVNGVRDEADLAPLRIAPLAVGDQGAGRVEVPAAQRPYIRLFVRRDGALRALRGPLTGRELRAGVELALEGRDIVRDPRRWGGEVTVTLTVTDRGRSTSDRVRLKVAPVLFQHDLQRAERIFAAKPGPGLGVPPGPWSVGGGYRPREWRPFASSLVRAAGAAGLSGRDVTFTAGTEQWWRDIWRQDMVEPAAASVPAPGAGVHSMRVLLRAPVLWAPPEGGEATLSRSARLLFRDFRGPDVGVVQQVTPGRGPSGIDLQNFTGNFESVPPYKGHPHGRVLYGTAPRRAPDPAFVRMIEAQGTQPAVTIDTSWLLVGHVDETVHVVRARNERGWTLAVADPRQAVELLRRAQRAGEGGQRLFADTTAEHKPTVDALLADGAFLAGNEEAARHIDDQIGVLLRETGLSRSDLVRVPVLYAMAGPAPGVPEGAIAYSPSIANGLSLTARDYAAPDPHGPKVDGRDLFRAAAQEALAAGGVRVHWVENFAWSHLAGGEVHCATNALRDPSGGVPWWSTAPGR
ncbi:protein-arginine deiminase family protein [Streptomyces sp. NPDC050164]|uniref:protein-arginine deiminase family protein n=1 Tax=Streptomyces sp. NPDC050164 TaxID=3365605 RepID=UPI0037ABA15A